MGEGGGESEEGKVWTKGRFEREREGENETGGRGEIIDYKSHSRILV